MKRIVVLLSGRGLEHVAIAALRSEALAARCGVIPTVRAAGPQLRGAPALPTAVIETAPRAPRD